MDEAPSTPPRPPTAGTTARRRPARRRPRPPKPPAPAPPIPERESDPDQLIVGRIAGAHGVRGAFRMVLITNRPEGLAALPGGDQDDIVVDPIPDDIPTLAKAGDIDSGRADRPSAERELSELMECAKQDAVSVLGCARALFANEIQ